MSEVETSKGRPFGDVRREEGEKGRRPGRLLDALKALFLLCIFAASVFGLMSNGLYDDEISWLWLPVAATTLGLLFIAVLTRGFFDGVSREGWVLVSLLAALVLIKGLSMIWTVS